MRHDRPAKQVCNPVDTPCGRVYDMDVWLTHEEIAILTQGQLMPNARLMFEPWLRITCGADDVTAAGIEVVNQDEERNA